MSEQFIPSDKDADCADCIVRHDAKYIKAERDALEVAMAALKEDDFDTLRVVEAERDVLAADAKALGGTCKTLAEENARLREQVGNLALGEHAKGEEVTRLHADVARLESKLVYLRDENAAGTLENARLREALRKYGKHAADCNTRLDKEAT